MATYQQLSDLVVGGTLTLETQYNKPVAPSGAIMRWGDGYLYEYVSRKGVLDWYRISSDTAMVTHIQDIASETWIVEHNLGTTDFIYGLYNEHGESMGAQLSNTSENSFHINFPSLKTGKCIIFAGTSSGSVSGTTPSPIQVLDTLSSVSTSQALSANMGRVLNSNIIIINSKLNTVLENQSNTNFIEKNTNIDMNGHFISNVTLASYAEPVTPYVHDTNGILELNYVNGHINKVEINADCELLLKSSLEVQGMINMLLIITSSTGTLTFSNAIFSGGDIPSLSGGTDILSFSSIDGGDTWFGFVVGKDMK